MRPPEAKTIPPKNEGVAAWENEGGASALDAIVPPRTIATNASVDPMHHPEPRLTLGGADIGITDTHTLAVMRISLLLLIPAFTVMIVFWAAIVTRSSG
jgi:hypothetical protein